MKPLGNASSHRDASQARVAGATPHSRMGGKAEDLEIIKVVPISLMRD